MLRVLCVCLGLAASAAFMDIDGGGDGAMVVRYDASSQSWMVDTGARFSADLVIPLACWEPAVCGEVTASGIVPCEALLGLLQPAGWKNEPLEALLAAGGACDGVLGRLGEAAQRAEAQKELRDVCAGGCIQVQVPRGLRVFNDAGLQRWQVHSNHSGDPDAGRGEQEEVYDVPVTLVFVSVAADLFSVHAQRLHLQLKHDASLGAAIVSVAHWCTQLGLVAPELSTMDIFRTPVGRQVCVWTCRPDHVRWPWNSHPGRRDEADGVRRCRPIPEQFGAVVFDMFVLTTARNPVPELLWYAVFDGLESAAAQMEAALARAGVRGAMVSLKVPDSEFDDMAFSKIVANVVTFREQAHAYSVIVNHLHRAVGARRLLESQAQVQAVLYVEGLLVFEEGGVKPSALGTLLRAASANVSLSAESGLVSGGRNLQLLQVHRLDAEEDDTEALAQQAVQQVVVREYALSGVATALVVCGLILVLVTGKFLATGS